jgi:membrane carboxypeptidase/penicillin-binding protein
VPVESRSGERLPIPVERRNFILRNLRGHGAFTTLSEREYQQALGEPIVLQPEPPLVYQAPHFVWHMKQELDRLLIDRAPAERGGYTVITTLDWDAQQLAEKYITAATIYTQESEADLDLLIEENGLEQDREWLGFLRGKDIHNGALVALDARTGDILAYVGSAGYYREDLASTSSTPSSTSRARATAQPGSAWKPMIYAAGFDNETLTPGTLLFDTTTEFARDRDGSWVPRNADAARRGPVLARDALYFSLNTTAIRALDTVGVDAVAQLAERMQLTFPRGGNRRMYTAGLAGALGTVEVNMLEYASAFSAFGTGGQQAPRSILEIRDSNGEVIYRAGEPERRQVMSPRRRGW